MTFKAEETENFEKIFASNKEKIRQQEGCRHLELLLDTEDSRCYSTYSIWNSSEDLDKYRQSELFGKIWKATKTLFAEKATASCFTKKAILP